MFITLIGSNDDYGPWRVTRVVDSSSATTHTIPKKNHLFLTMATHIFGNPIACENLYRMGTMSPWIAHQNVEGVLVRSTSLKGLLQRYENGTHLPILNCISVWKEDPSLPLSTTCTSSQITTKKWVEYERDVAVEDLFIYLFLIPNLDYKE